ncbi:hypothetical protein ZWY2020_046768 [Hordeum vulgare]|nr:hypothetical protein ZWY2020_046768 [Hordeum vulgare]
MQRVGGRVLHKGGREDKGVREAGHVSNAREAPVSTQRLQGAPSLPRPTLVFLIALFGLYVCYLSFNQIRMEASMRRRIAHRTSEHVCAKPYVPSEELPYVHFPKPKGYSRVDRRENISSIVQTLDKLYNLDWLTSAAKNECTAAFGFKWMLNQGFMDHRDDILSYLNKKGISVIFLFRRNTLRRLISVLANNYDRDAKQLNGTHKSHVHSEEEAEILAKFRPQLGVSTLVSNIRDVESTWSCLDSFNTTAHGPLLRGHNQKQKCIIPGAGIHRRSVRKLVSRQVKIHTRPLLT